MCECLARRHDAISVVNASFVHGGKDVDSLARLFAPVKQARKFFLMFTNQIIEALMSAAKRFSVGWENKNIRGYALFQVVQ